jgi:hypothetical protein
MPVVPNKEVVMGINRQTLQAWLQKWHNGEIPFDAPLGEDSYFSRVAEEGVDLQPQLRAAFELRESGQWDNDTYQIVRGLLEEEYNVRPAEHKGEATATFTPWAPEVKSRPIPEGWSVDSQGNLICTAPERSAMTGRVQAAETVKPTRATKSTDPVRSKSGRFLPFVAEVWYYDPSDWMVRRQVFAAGQDAIAKAWQRAKQLSESWAKLGVKGGCVWVKYRSGEMKGNRWVFLADASGILATPHEVTRLQSQAQAHGIRARVGERQSSIKVAVIEAMHKQNAMMRASGNDLTCIDVPCVEPDDPSEIVYSIRFQSGDRRTITIHPLSDDTDDDGNVILAGHRKRAYRLLLDTPSGGVDSPRTIMYVWYDEDGKPHKQVIGRDAAITWAEEQGEEEDEVLVKLHEDFTEGRISDDEYVTKRGRRLMQIDPPDPYRRGPTMHNPPTRVDYVNGRHYWGKARNTSTPGSRWVGGMSYLEAQLYNMS